MKKFKFTLLLTLFFFSSFSQDTVRIIHQNYTTVFSKSKKYPVLVEWWITKDEVGCRTPLKRKDTFKPDPKLPYSLNAGDWKSLETLTRESILKNDSIHIWCGNVGEIKKIGKVSVPKYCWKVIYFVSEKLFMSFLFENDGSKSDGLKNNEVDLDVIKEVTGFDFRKN